MMKRLTALLLCALLALTPALAEGGAILDGRWLCSELQGNVTEDTSAGLVDDFYLSVNKAWMLWAEIPDGHTVTGAIIDVDRILMDRQIALMKDGSLTGHDAELVHKLYALIVDWDYRNAQGVEPAMPVVEALRAIDSLEALEGYLYDANNIERVFPLTIDVEPDYTDSNTYITYVRTPSLMMNDSAEYAEPSQTGEVYGAMYRLGGGHMLQRLGYSEDEAAGVVENAFAFEAMLAEHIKPMSAHYEADYLESCLNYYSPGELQALAGGFPILDMIQAYGVKLGKRFLVEEPDYIAALAGLYTEENAALIRDWMALKTAYFMYDMLDQETERSMKAILYDIIGATGEVSDDDNALETIRQFLPVPMDNLYIRAYCTEQQREDILAIIADVVACYRDMLESEDWLSDATRAKAIEKLDHLRVRAVYPDVLGDWSGLDFDGPEDGGSLLAARAAADAFKHAIMSERIDTAVDRVRWDQVAMMTAEVNAYYEPKDNSMNIMAGILNGEIYNEDMSYEQMLGGIGTVIGHEISHAFDTDGAQYDKDGVVSNWWTDEDYAAFRARAEKLAAWYDGFIPYEGVAYSGKQVQGEVIADMGGVKCALGIAAQREDFDYDAFFRQYAVLWRQQELPYYLLAVISMDVHPLNYMRVNATLAQFDEFVDCYGIQPGDGMYIAPEDRVAVW